MFNRVSCHFVNVMYFQMHCLMVIFYHIWLWRQSEIPNMLTKIFVFRLDFLCVVLLLVVVVVKLLLKGILIMCIYWPACFNFFLLLEVRKLRGEGKPLSLSLELKRKKTFSHSLDVGWPDAYSCSRKVEWFYIKNCSCWTMFSDDFLWLKISLIQFF